MQEAYDSVLSRPPFLAICRCLAAPCLVHACDCAREQIEAGCRELTTHFTVGTTERMDSLIVLMALENR